MPGFCAPADIDILNYEISDATYNKMFSVYERKMSKRYKGTQLIGGQLGAYKSVIKFNRVKRLMKGKTAKT